MTVEAPVKYVIFDLDGLILDTETLCCEVASKILSKYGKTLSKEAKAASLGRRPLDAWAEVARLLDIQEAPAALLQASEALLTDRWSSCKMLPGALRLIQHLAATAVPFAIATSTPRSTFNKKMSGHPELAGLIGGRVVCGDEVAIGKPAPDVFLAAAKLLGVPAADASSCLVFEDAPSGVVGAIAAGMRVIAVPSAGTSHTAAASLFPPLIGSSSGSSPAGGGTAGGGGCGGGGGLVQILPSLLALDLSSYGLPPFNDLVAGGIPVQPVLHIKGTVVKGFGRGSAQLGIPTANVDGDSLRVSLAEAVTGIYAGWASVGESAQVYKMVMSIGWNPFYGNEEKTAEPWLLHTFDAPFYGQQIRLVCCCYIRPEANFPSLQALVDRIHADGAAARQALDHPRLAAHCDDPHLRPAAA